jgi:hypothetical protein
MIVCRWSRTCGGGWPTYAKASVDKTVDGWPSYAKASVDKTVGGWPTYVKASVDKTVGGWQKRHSALSVKR